MNEALQQQQTQLTEQQEHIETNKATIAVNTARFGNEMRCLLKWRS
jgi:hypothetical protein